MTSQGHARVDAPSRPESSAAPEGLVHQAALTAKPEGGIPPIVQEVLASPGQPLDPETRAVMEPRFGHDFSRVRVHTDVRAAKSAHAVDARAYTVGRDLVFDQGRYHPETQDGQQVLAHELAHVVQQSRGGSAPLLDPASPLEQAADRAAHDVVNGSGPVSVAGASRPGIARQSYTGDIPINLFQDLDVSKMTPEARKQMSAAIDARLRYLDTQANKPAPVSSGITIPGLGASNPDAERSQLFDWKKKLDSGTGVIVAQGIPRSSPPPIAPPLVSTPPVGTPSATASKGTSQSRSHSSPPGYVASKGGPYTLEDTIKAANVDPHKSKDVSIVGSANLRPLTDAEWKALYPAGGGATTGGQQGSPQSRTHASPPGYTGSKGGPYTLEDTIKAANADPHQAGKKPAINPALTAISPEDRQAVLDQLKPHPPGEVTMPDGQKVIIPPKPPGELTEDITFGESTLAKANVQGVRAMVVHNLDAELKRIEGNTEISRMAAYRFLTDWPIMRRLADLVASADPPSGTIWLDVDKLIQQSRIAIRDGNLETAVSLTKQANQALQNAQSAWGRYKDRNLGGAESIKTGAENTRDAAKYTLMGLAIVASGGTAAPWVATAGGIAIDVADVVARAALGEKINWGAVTADIAVQVVTAKFGGKLSSGLFKALVEDNPVTHQMEQNILKEAVEALMTGAESRTLGAGIRQIYQSASAEGNPMTWDQFIDQLTDPKSVIIDILIGMAKGIQIHQAAVAKGTTSGQGTTIGQTTTAASSGTKKAPSKTGIELDPNRGALSDQQIPSYREFDPAQLQNPPRVDVKTGTEYRSGMYFHEYNAAEASTNRLRFSYNAQEGRPEWIEFEVHGAALGKSESTRSFTADPTIQARQPSNKAYVRSGQDRGHLAQREAFAGDTERERAVDSHATTVPMAPSLNRGAGSPWRAAEERTIDYARRYGAVKVRVEPIYDANPPHLPDGVTPIPKGITRTVTTMDGTVLESITFDNRISPTGGSTSPSSTQTRVATGSGKKLRVEDLDAQARQQQAEQEMDEDESTEPSDKKKRRYRNIR